MSGQRLVNQSIIEARIYSVFVQRQSRCFNVTHKPTMSTHLSKR